MQNLSVKILHNCYMQRNACEEKFPRQKPKLARVISNNIQIIRVREFLIIPFFALVLVSVPNVFAQNYENYGVKVEVVAENLEIPWSIVFSPDDRIFFTERKGSLRVIENNQLNPNPIASFSVGGGEGGLLGIALDPNFEENHFVYLYQTYNEFLSTFNKIVRYKESDNKLVEEKILLDKIPGAIYHDGGRIKFGPDGKLYITTGDAGNTKLAQDLNSLAGKILRINPDGTIPEDNPFENSAIYSYGHRNPQGIDWDSSGKLIASEHGPSGERGRAHDEINLIEVGKNYGWPNIVGDEKKEGLVNPILHSGDDTWAPSGITFYNSDKIPSWNGKLFVATLRGSHLKILDMDLSQNKISSEQNIFVNEFGRLRDVVVGPDQNLYILTSNNDGRGGIGGNYDKILKVSPLVEVTNEFANLPALKQVQNGVKADQVTCKDGLILILKSHNGFPACVSPSTAEKLETRGWGFVPQ